MKKTLSVIVASISIYAVAAPASAQDAKLGTSQTASTVAPAAPEMIDAEVKKVDKDAKKVTLKHGEIKSLDMPAMTMVFQVKDAAMLDKVKAGDKVRVNFQQTKSGYVVSAIEAAK